MSNLFIDNILCTIFAANSEQLARLEALIDELNAAKDGGDKMHVYRVQYRLTAYCEAIDLDFANSLI